MDMVKVNPIVESFLFIVAQTLIHELYFENTEEGLSVNFKKQNTSTVTGVIPSLLINPFIQTLKSICNLDPDVFEIPQLGKLNFKVDAKELTASVSAFPTINGERILIKIYHKKCNISTVIMQITVFSLCNQQNF